MDNFWKMLTILLTAFAVYVGYRQFQLARDKFKLDLFEKRFAVFAATRKFLSDTASKGSVPTEQIFQFRASIAETSFLFDKCITDYLEEISNRILKLDLLETKLNSAIDVAERNRLLDVKSNELIWVMDQLPLLISKFSPYLKFDVWSS